jgi:low temperature requirement protein LtrA
MSPGPPPSPSLMACTALLPASARVPAWGLLDAAYLAVFGVVILTASAGASLIVTDALIERFGTLTIIVLGEILTSVVAGLASQPLSALTLSVGLVAVVVGFGAWWTYFDFTGQRQAKPTRPATALWVLGHLPLTASIAAMGAAVVSLVDHAHASRTPEATAWILCGGAAVVLCATILVSASLQARQGDPALHQLLTRSCIPVAAACLGLGAARPAPLLLGVALVFLLGVPWVLAVAHHLERTSGSRTPQS